MNRILFPFFFLSAILYAGIGPGGGPIEGTSVRATGITDGYVLTATSGVGAWSSVAGAGLGDVSGPAASVDSEIALFNSTTGKLIKRASGTGLCKAVSGVASFATLVNADVSASAAIARSKIAVGTASHVVINHTDGSLTSEATLDKTRGGAGADMSSVTFPSSGTIATRTASETFTNKTLTSPVITTPTGFIETFTGHLEAPTVKPYILDQFAAYAYTVNSIVSQCDSGTVDFDLEIDGTDITGCAGQQMASSEATDTCTAANSVSAGNTLRINVSAVSSPDDCRFTVKYTR